MSESISTVFPADVDVEMAQFGGPGGEHSTAVLPYADGGSQRLALFRPAGLRVVSGLIYVDETDINRVMDFLDARRGQFEPFYFFVPVTKTYTDYLVGTTAGGAGETFTMPFMGTAVSAVKVDGSAVVGGYSISAGTGTYGEDVLTITAAQTSAKPVTVTLTGRLRLGVRNTVDRNVPQLVPDLSPTMWEIPFAFVEV